MTAWETKERPRIGVMGSGAVGSIVGGLIADSGEDVTLVDQWPEHVETIRRQGLRLDGACGDRLVEVPALHIHELQSVTEPFDVILLAVKSYDTEWATRLGLGYLGGDGVVVTLQNGINEPRVAAIAGAERTLGCVTLIGARLAEAGRATKTDIDPIGFKVGELDGSNTPRARRLAELIGAVSLTEVTDNLWGERWSKLALNCIVNPLSALSGLGAGEVRADARSQAIGIHLGAEAILVGRAAGYEVEPVFGIPAQEIVDAAAGRGVDDVKRRIGGGATARGIGWPSMLQDVMKQRRTEVDYLNGFVVAEGERLGVPTPLNAALVEQFHALGTAFEPKPEYLEPLLARAGAA
jgi:2-dehydropantoate 2-reductase